MSITSDFSFGVGNPASADVRTALTPFIAFNGTESSGGWTQIGEVTGAEWLTVNATYNATLGGFQQIDATKASFAIQITSTIANFLTCPAGTLAPIVWQTGSFNGNFALPGTITFATVNAGTFESLNGNGVLRLFNVRDFGALGNGTSDDTTAIQTASSAAEAAHGICYLPYGTYKITGSLSGGADLHWLGQGLGSQIINATTAASLVISYTTPLASYERAPRLEGMTFINSSSSTFTGVTVTTSGFASNAIGGSIVIDKCHFNGTNNGTGTLLTFTGCNGVMLTSCDFASNNAGTIANEKVVGVSLNGTQLLQATNCVFNFCGTGVSINDSSGNHVEGCSFSQCFFDGCFTGIHSSNSQEVEYIGCQIANGAFGVVSVGDASCSFVGGYIDNANATLSAHSLMTLDTNGSGVCSNWRIVGNLFHNFLASTTSMLIGFNTSVGQPTNMNVSHNSFIGTGNYWIFVTFCINSVIQGNNMATGFTTAAVGYTTANFQNSNPFIVRGNFRFIAGAQTPPTVPLTTVDTFNSFPFDCIVTVTAGAGSTCTVAIGGQNIAVVAASGVFTFYLDAGQFYHYTYTSAPTHAWFGR